MNGVETTTSKKVPFFGGEIGIPSKKTQRVAFQTFCLMTMGASLMVLGAKVKGVLRGKEAYLALGPLALSTFVFARSVSTRSSKEDDFLQGHFEKSTHAEGDPIENFSEIDPQKQVSNGVMAREQEGPVIEESEILTPADWGAFCLFIEDSLLVVETQPSRDILEVFGKRFGDDQQERFSVVRQALRDFLGGEELVNSDEVKKFLCAREGRDLLFFREEEIMRILVECLGAEIPNELKVNLLEVLREAKERDIGVSIQKRQSDLNDLYKQFLIDWGWKQAEKRALHELVQEMNCMGWENFRQIEDESKLEALLAEFDETPRYFSDEIMDIFQKRGQEPSCIFRTRKDLFNQLIQRLKGDFPPPVDP